MKHYILMVCFSLGLVMGYNIPKPRLIVSWIKNQLNRTEILVLTKRLQFNISKMEMIGEEHYRVTVKRREEMINLADEIIRKARKDK